MANVRDISRYIKELEERLEGFRAMAGVKEFDSYRSGIDSSLEEEYLKTQTYIDGLQLLRERAMADEKASRDAYAKRSPLHDRLRANDSFGRDSGEHTD